MNNLPAIVIGGPPNSGKSVLTYSLTQALRDSQTEHFVVRAAPDGEGDWNTEAPVNTVLPLRQRAKGIFTGSFVVNLCSALQKRHLPLIVDVGGLISPEQEKIVDQCTHAILISSNASELAKWRDFAKQQQLTIIAELHSTLTQEDEIFTTSPILSARIAGLERGLLASGAAFEELLSNVRTLFAIPKQELREMHLATAPCTPLEFDELGHKLNVQDNRWLPANMAQIAGHVTAKQSHALYGRGPNWLYATLAAHIYPAALHQFDSLLGWIRPTQPQLSADAKPHKLKWSLTDESEQLMRLRLTIVNGTYLNYSDSHTITLPPQPNAKGLIIGGKLPQWLFTGLVNAYHDIPMLAIYQPQVGAVVVKSTLPEWPIGQVIPAAE